MNFYFLPFIKELIDAEKEPGPKMVFKGVGMTVSG